MKVTIFNGSLRKDGDTAAATSYLKELIAKADADVNEYFLFHMNIKGCLTCGPGTGREKAAEMVRELASGDLVIIASPVYMYRPTDSVIALLNVLHSMCRDDDGIADAVRGKRTAIILTGEEDAAAVAAGPLRQMCGSLGMNVIDPVAMISAGVAECPETLRDLADKILQ